MIRSLVRGIGVLAAAALAVAALSCGGREEQTPIPTPVGTPAATPTSTAPRPSPAATPTARRTPVPPTATATAAPTPTATPSPTATAMPTSTPSPTPVPSPTPQGPEDAAAKAMALLVADLSASAADVAVESVEAVEWTDASLGCPEPGRSYARVIVPGWSIVLSHGGRTFEYHADRAGDVIVSCQPAPARAGVGPPATAIDLPVALGIANPVRVIVSAVLPDGATRELARVEDPPQVQGIVAALGGPLILKERDPCTTLFHLEFEMTGGSAAITYGCPGNGTVIRGDQDFWAGNDGIAPVEFQRLVNAVLASRPFPGMPGGG